MQSKNTFLEGKMNKDLDLRVLPENQYTHAENIRIVSPDGSNAGTVRPSFGNSQLTSLSKPFNPRALGYTVDPLSNMIYYAARNDSNECYIVEYDVENDITTEVLNDNRVGDSNILNFQDSSFPIDMKILNDVENGRKFLIITDDLNEPKCFDIEYAKTLGALFTEDQVCLLRQPPEEAPDLLTGAPSANEINNLNDKFFMFAYRYRYRYGEFSAMSPFSRIAFWPEAFSYDYTSSVNEAMTNLYANVLVSIRAGSGEVTDVELIAKEPNSNALFIVESYNKADLGWGDNTTQFINFTNDKILRQLTETEITRLYDNVPITAKAAEIIGNRLVFANYRESYDLTNQGAAVVPTFTTDYTSTVIAEDTAYETVKSITQYEVAIAYLDGKGRMTTPFTSPGGTVQVSNTDSDTQNTLRVTISSLPPDFAEQYRIFIRESRTNYHSIASIVFYNDVVGSDNFVWTKINTADIDKISEGDFIYLRYSGTLGPIGVLQEATKHKIIEISQQATNFLGGGEEEGLYFKIQAPSVSAGGGNVIVFETEGDRLSEGLFYETNKTYNVTDVAGVKYHFGGGIAGDQNQTGAQDAIIVLHDLFNAYGWANSFESNRILDSFGENYIRFDTRSSTPIDDYRQIKRTASLTYSGVYENTTGYNALNEFNLSDENYKDMDTSYGGIQLLYSRDTDLVVFQEDKTHRVLYTKDVLFDADGQGNVKESNNVLGQEIAYVGEYGIGLHPESFAFYGNRIYHIDKERGALMRLSLDGYTEISQNGFYDYFRTLFKDNPSANFVGQYNPYDDIYLINTYQTGTTANTLAFNERVSGFTSFYSFVPEVMMYLNNRLYSVSGGELYLHDDENANINEFYGVKYDSVIESVFNESPSEVKVFKTINQEGDVAWDVDLTTNLANGLIPSSEFVNKEGEWYAHIRRSEDTTDTSSLAIQGVGELSSESGTTMTLKNLSNTSLSIGDTLYKYNTGTFALDLIGVVQTYDFTANTIVVDAVTNIPATDDFIVFTKNSRIEASSMRGYYLLCNMTYTGTSPVELFAVNSDIFKSYE